MSRYPGLPVDLIFIRHGESEGNVADQMKHRGDASYREKLGEKGSYDYRLTERGQLQAKKTGEWLKSNKVPITSYYVSDLVRTKETAALLGLEDAKWLADIDLREQDLRSVDDAGLSVATVRSEAPEHFLTMLIRNHSAGEQCVVAVCHATIIRSFMLRIENARYTDLSSVASEFDQTVHNCQIVWYSRRDPHTGKITDRLNWKATMIAYADYAPKREAMHWEHFGDIPLSNYDLMREVEDSGSVLEILDSVDELEKKLPVLHIVNNRDVEIASMI